MHQSNILMEGFRSLREEEQVEFEIEEMDGRTKAVQVTGPGGAPPQGAPPRRYRHREDGEGGEGGRDGGRGRGRGRGGRGRGRGTRGGPTPGGFEANGEGAAPAPVAAAPAPVATAPAPVA